MMAGLELLWKTVPQEAIHGFSALVHDASPLPGYIEVKVLVNARTAPLSILLFIQAACGAGLVELRQWTS
jgi:hypothetical protein